MELLIFFIIILIVGIIIRLIINYLATINLYKHKKNDTYEFNGTLNKTILTENEQKYYNILRKNIDNSYIIFTKVRLADIIKTNNYNDFNKIRGKHIDFVICDNKTKPLLFIELDDKTHNNYKNKINDNKKNIILYNVGIELIRTTINNIEDNIRVIKQKLEETKNT